MASVIENVIRVVTESLKAAVTSNVVISTHTDYTEIAAIPAIVLFYPNVEDFRPNETNERRIEKNEDGRTTTIRPPLVFKNLVFDFEIYADRMLGANGLAALHERMVLWLERTGTIEVDGVEYEVHGDIEANAPNFEPNISNIKRVIGTFTIEGVQFDDGSYETGYIVLDRIFESEEKG